MFTQEISFSELLSTDIYIYIYIYILVLKVLIYSTSFVFVTANRYEFLQNAED